MESSANGGDKKMSFGFSLGDERIKLIDIVSEDDDFLVASPFCDSLGGDSFSGRIEHFGEQALFRLSGFGCSQDVEKIQERERNRLPADVAEGRRRSYLRKSLAWDTAFINSAGVLDPDELSLINKGFGADSHLLPATHGVRKRRPESETTGNDDGSSLEWFEIEPFEKRRPTTYKSNSSKGFNIASMSLDLGPRKERLHNTRAALEKVDESARNKMKSNQTAVRKSISLHAEEMKKLKETTDRSRIRASSSAAKPPKSWCRSVNDSTGSNRTDLPGKSNAKMTRFGPGQSMISERQSATERSPPSSTIAVPFNAASSPRASFSTSKRKTETEPRKCKLYSSLSTSKIFRDSERSKGIGNTSSHSKSLLNRPTFSSPASYSSQYSSQSLSSSLRKKRRSNVDTKTTNLGPSLQNDVKEAAEPSSFGSLSAKNFKPSELRPPSPKMGFFDEETCSQGAKSRKMLQNVEPEGTLHDTDAQFHSFQVLQNSSISSGTCNKLRSGISDTVRKIRSASLSLSKDKQTLLETKKVSDAKRPRNRIGLNSSMEEQKRKDPLKNKRCRGNPGPVEDVNTIKKRNGVNGCEDRIGNLSRFFEAIALDQDKTKQFEHKNKTGNKGMPVFSKQENQLSNSSPMRTPLADKSSACNFSQTRSLPLQPKKEKLVQTDTVYTTSLGTGQGETVSDK